MRYPEISIRTKVIAENAGKVVSLCSARGINVWGVTKGVSANPSVAGAMLDGGCAGLADSRMDNIRKMRLFGIREPMMLLRIPMPGEMKQVAAMADVCLMSMPESISMLDKACEDAGTKVGVIIMVDLGDLREGIWPDGVAVMAEAVSKCRRIRCLGAGSNLGCLSGVLPTVTNLSLLVSIAREFETFLGYPLEVVSGGATSSLPLVEDASMPPGVSQLRIGEAILLGTDVSGGRAIPYLSQDAIRISAEVVEVRSKPSLPIGETGSDAFGNKPVFENRGIRRRAILAIGRQDIRPEGLAPIDKGISIIGASSDHLTLDVEEFDGSIRPGDVVSFSPDYGATLAATTSAYVRTRIIES
ncbi:MAG: alanine/ornithine racemase family PLP-dependent enzyme [Thermovirgaceae bacterium]|nr:alanine/ornithine racemase family PLP-dependent enzyme [Thermovirgaceae bacterium]